MSPEVPRTARETPSNWVRFAFWYLERVQRLPRWGRPAAHFAAIVAFVVLIRALMRLFTTGLSLELLASAAAIPVGAYFGAVGGIAYYAVRGRLQPLGKLAPYITGIVCVTAYALVFAIPAVLLTSRELLNDPTTVFIMLFLIPTLGLILGWVLRSWEMRSH